MLFAVCCRFESELSIRQSVEADIVGLRKVIDDTNMGRMNLESEIEALKEELIFLKKNHDNVSSPWPNPPFQPPNQYSTQPPPSCTTKQMFTISLVITMA
jgi:hypothetical protein